MPRCFNNLKIFPGPKSQGGNLAGAFSICRRRQLSRKIQTGFQIGKPEKLKSSKEFDKYGPRLKRGHLS